MNYVFYCSSSISNWREKLRNRFKLDDWSYFGSMFRPAIFFGMYNYKDWFRFLWHRGEKVVFWAGTDILYLQQRPVWQWLIVHSKAKHICENQVEWNELFKMRIKAKIQPCLIDNASKYQVCFKPSKKPHVWLSAHVGRETEYGIDRIETIADDYPNITFHIYGVPKPEVWFDLSIMEMRNISHVSHKNIIYHGKVSEKRFNEEIKNYQGALRLNKFDGFGEVLAKALLLGQYVYSYIEYPQVERNLKHFLDKLLTRTTPNIAEKYWRKELSKTLEEIIQ